MRLFFLPDSGRWESVVVTCTTPTRYYFQLAGAERHVQRRELDRQGCTSSSALRRLVFLAVPVNPAVRALGLGPDATVDDVKAAYRRQAKVLHPDVAGGTHDAFVELTKSYERAMASVGGT